MFSHVLSPVVVTVFCNMLNVLSAMNPQVQIAQHVSQISGYWSGKDTKIGS